MLHNEKIQAGVLLDLSPKSTRSLSSFKRIPFLLQEMVIVHSVYANDNKLLYPI